MRFFFVSDTVQHIYSGTLSQAHHLAKNGKQDGRPFRQDWVKIEEVEIATDKAGILALLNGVGGNEMPIREWTLTPRGGLHEEKPIPKCPTCGNLEFYREGDRYRCECGATWFPEEE